LARPAFALSCDEVMNMVNVNVPTSIVVQTLTESGEKFNADFVRCLVNEGAPDEVVGAAKQQMAAAAAPSEDAGTDDTPAQDKIVSKKEAARDEFDSADEIGSKKKGRELTDASAEEEEDTSRDPQRLEDAIAQYNAKKPVAASKELAEMLQEDAFPDKKGKVLFYLGRSLFDLKLHNSAEYYFIELLKLGPSNPYFKYALPKLVTIARYTGDWTKLAKVVAKIPPEEYPRSARTQMNYLLAMRLYEQEKLSEAKKYFGQVPEKSDLYTRSKYMEGIIYNKQNRLKSAVRSFNAVARTKAEAQTQQELEELDRLRDLSILNMARIYYSIERFDEANKLYAQLPRDSRYWPQAQFESAWANFLTADLNLTLGQILTVESPFYYEDEFIPEATVLKALTYFNLCNFADVDRTLLQFDRTYRPVHMELKDALNQYKGEENRKMSDQVFDRYWGGKGESAMPKSMFNRMLRNSELAGYINKLDTMDAEEDAIAAMKSAWKTSVGEQLVKLLASEREQLKRRAGLETLKEMSKLATYLGDLLGQAEIIRFEVVDAKRADYVYKMQNVDLKDSSRGQELDFATSAKFIYWPFNGEFWQDELGAYQYAEQARCN
jgi:TolA-binding protein